MIFLLRLSDLNEWHQLHSRRKEYLRCSIDSPQVHHCLRIFTFDFLEHVPQRVKTIINIVIAGIALCKIKRKRRLENCGRKKSLWNINYKSGCVVYVWKYRGKAHITCHTQDANPQMNLKQNWMHLLDRNKMPITSGVDEYTVCNIFLNGWCWSLYEILPPATKYDSQRVLSALRSVLLRALWNQCSQRLKCLSSIMPRMPCG